MTLVEWEEIGIPPGYGPEEFLYNPPTQMLVVELRSVGKKFQPNRLYRRHKDEGKYLQIGNPEPDVSYESPVTLLTRPMLFFNAMRIVRREGRVGSNWEAVYSFDLNSSKLMLCFDKKEIRLPSPFSDCWVTDLVSASEDGSHLYLRFGMCEEERRGVRYSLARIDLATKTVEPISWLKGVFF